LTYFPLLAKNYFPIGLTSVKYGRNGVNTKDGKVIMAIVDSGTSLVTMNPAIFTMLNPNFNVGKQFSCKEMNRLKNFCIEIAMEFNTNNTVKKSRSYCLTPEQYVINGGDDVCEVGLSPMDSGTVAVILGDTFMKHFTTVFDMERNRVGIYASGIMKVMFGVFIGLLALVM